MELIKVFGVGILISILIIVTKQIKPELAVGVLVAGVCFLSIYIINYFTNIFSLFEDIIRKTGVSISFFTTLIKIIGVGYLAEFSAGICSDTGNIAVADKMILAGKILIFILAIPIITQLFELIIGLLP